MTRDPLTLLACLVLVIAVGLLAAPRDASYRSTPEDKSKLLPLARTSRGKRIPVKMKQFCPAFFEIQSSLSWQIISHEKGRGRARSAANVPGESINFHVKSQALYHLKVTLMDAHPPIWRELEVPGEIHLAELHAVLQIAMWWTNSHMHQFRIGESTHTPGRRWRRGHDRRKNEW